MLISCYKAPEPPPPPPEPKLGDVKLTRRFAWLPVWVYKSHILRNDEHCTIWLEHYTIVEVYQKVPRWFRYGKKVYYFDEWVIDRVERG